ncbi:MAG: hypothetical protein V7742_22775 [Halioglobus sp.]
MPLMCNRSVYKFIVSFLLVLAGVSLPAVAQEAVDYDLEDIEVSYIYAALMGTGSYKVDGRRITMLRMPFTWTQKKMTETQVGFKWHMPVVIGHDKIEGSDWFEELFPQDLVTLTALPGFEYQIPVTPDWAVKPFGHIGYTHDFVSNEDIVMAVLGVSSVARYYLDEEGEWELRWGNKVRFAAERQHKSKNKSSFGIFETGIDIRRGTGFRVYRREVDLGGYYRFQYFLPEWNISEAPDRHSDIDNIHELGFSVGLERPKKLLGISFSRVRVGYKKGGNIRGFTIGGEFPF